MACAWRYSLLCTGLLAGLGVCRPRRWAFSGGWQSRTSRGRRLSVGPSICRRRRRPVPHTTRRWWRFPKQRRFLDLDILHRGKAPRQARFGYVSQYALCKFPRVLFRITNGHFRSLLLKQCQYSFHSFMRDLDGFSQGSSQDLDVVRLQDLTCALPNCRHFLRLLHKGIHVLWVLILPSSYNVV